MSSSHPIIVRQLGLRDYQSVWEEMKSFTENRNQETISEIWLVEHKPVFTQGQAGRPEHLLNPKDIPVVQSDRGGQVTYHGPGQSVIYLLLSLRDVGLGVRGLITAMENSVIMLLKQHGIEAKSRSDAPGVYVNDAKIAALGLRVKRGYSYHGLSFNIDMDLEPFSRINPCGYQDMKVTQTSLLGIEASFQQLTTALVDAFCKEINQSYQIT